MKTKLIPCKACGRSIAKSAATCPHCGKSSTSLARIGLLAVLVLILLYLTGVGKYAMTAVGGYSQHKAGEARMNELRVKQKELMRRAAEASGER